MPHSVQVVYNRLWIDSPVSPAHNVSKLPVIHCGVDAVDVLLLYVLDAWAKPPAQHGECGEVQFRVAMRIRIMFLEALPVTRRCPAFAPVDRCIQA